MANVDNAYGLKPVRHRNGAPYNGAGSLYYKASSDTTPLAPGDPVVVTGTASTDGIPTVTRATAGTSNALTGVVIARTNGDGTLLQTSALNSPASTEDWLLIEDNPDVVFTIQCSGAFAVTDMSNNANLSAGTATEGKSGFELDSTSFGTGATLQLKVLRLYRDINNSVGTNAQVEVMINNHTQATGKAGV